MTRAAAWTTRLKGAGMTAFTRQEATNAVQAMMTMAGTRVGAEMAARQGSSEDMLWRGTNRIC